MGLLTTPTPRSGRRRGESRRRARAVKRAIASEPSQFGLEPLFNPFGSNPGQLNPLFQDASVVQTGVHTIQQKSDRKAFRGLLTVGNHRED